VGEGQGEGKSRSHESPRPNEKCGKLGLKDIVLCGELLALAVRPDLLPSHRLFSLQPAFMLLVTLVLRPSDSEGCHSEERSDEESHHKSVIA
jgi:hypothetical protein